jgi:DNA-binding transcriptional ArsR family regulator
MLLYPLFVFYTNIRRCRGEYYSKKLKEIFFKFYIDISKHFDILICILQKFKFMAKKTEQKLELLPLEVLDESSDCLKVLAHPVRLRMVEILMQGKFAVHEIAKICELSPNQACDHLRLLKGHRLLDSKRHGRTVYYSIAAPEVIGIVECIRKNCRLK